MSKLKTYFFTILAVFCTSSMKAQNDSAKVSETDKPFKIFQFPKNQMPRIDGKADDWEIVPNSYAYGNEMLKDTEDGLGNAIDHTDDLNVSVKVGWVEGLSRLYFLYEARDDFWDFGRFNNKGHRLRR